MIEIKGLSKSFGDLTAVNDINLSVPKGEFFVILGPNAAGKTTTIKVMAGLMKPTSGSVHVCGHNIESEPLKARKRMAYLPDFPFLYDKLTPIEFFRFTGQLFGMSESHIQNESDSLSDRFSLGEFLSNPIESLSHGTKQRVAIVSALMHAATMVAAGVYMSVMLFPIFTPDALLVIAYIGAITAILAALIAVTQNGYTI